MKFLIADFFSEARCLLCLKEISMFNLISLEGSFKDLKITMETEGRINAQTYLFQEL